MILVYAIWKKAQILFILVIIAIKVASYSSSLLQEITRDIKAEILKTVVGSLELYFSDSYCVIVIENCISPKPLTLNQTQ